MQVRHATYGIHKFFITDDNFARNHDWEAIFDRLIELRDKALFWCRFVWGTLYKQAILVFTIGRLVLVKAGIDRDPNRQAYMEPASGSVVHPGANVRDDGRYPEGREVWGAGRGLHGDADARDGALCRPDSFSARGVMHVLSHEKQANASPA